MTADRSRDHHDSAWVLDWYNGLAPLRIIGMRAVGVGVGWSRAELDPPDDLRNPNGAVNGGVLSSFIDQTGGLTVAGTIRDSETAATIELGIHFLRAAKRTPLTATAHVVRRGRSFMFLSIEVEDDHGQACLNATGTWAVGRGSGLPDDPAIESAV